MNNFATLDMPDKKVRSSKPLTFSRKLGFSAVFLLFSFVFAVGVLLAIDLYWHSKFPIVPNHRGYRGRVVGRKQANELRLVVVGGSTALGYGVAVQNTFPAFLETKLRDRLHRPVSVVNLAWNSQGAYSFLPTLKDYEYLDYDGVVLYEGYNDLGYNKALFRHDSPIFMTFGYYPVIPMIVREKLLSMRYGGDLEKAYREELKKPGKTVFKPRGGDPEAAARVARALETQKIQESRSEDCQRWGFYCNSVRSAVEFARSRDKVVFVVTQPYAGDPHRSQQAELTTMLTRRFPDPNVHHINLGDAIDLGDPKLAYDGVHLVPAGNEIIAERLSEQIAPIISSPAKTTSR